MWAANPWSPMRRCPHPCASRLLLLLLTLAPLRVRRGFSGGSLVTGDALLLVGWDGGGSSALMIEVDDMCGEPGGEACTLVSDKLACSATGMRHNVPSGSFPPHHRPHLPPTPAPPVYSGCPLCGRRSAWGQTASIMTSRTPIKSDDGSPANVYGLDSTVAYTLYAENFPGRCWGEKINAAINEAMAKGGGSATIKLPPGQISAVLRHLSAILTSNSCGQAHSTSRSRYASGGSGKLQTVSTRPARLPSPRGMSVRCGARFAVARQRTCRPG